MVGNGHRLRNSSMGDTINTYDVVIRYSPGRPCGPPILAQCHRQLPATCHSSPIEQHLRAPG